MFVYYTLRNLASFFGGLRRALFDTGNNVRDVWLIGNTLTVYFHLWADWVGAIEDEFYILAQDWYGFYRYIADNLTVDNALNLLQHYADQLIDFARDPAGFINEYLQIYFPEFFSIVQHPVNFVYDILTRYLGVDINFIRDPGRYIHDFIDNVLGEVNDLRRDPWGYIIGKIADIMPTFYNFIYDPDGWVVDRIGARFPELMYFLQDPKGFVVDSVVDGFESFIDRYTDRLTKIAERILQAIF